MQSQPLHLVLCDKDAVMVRAWTQFCGDLEFVTIKSGSILNVPCDAVVSPANSFGFMDGGIDVAYLEYFGPTLQRLVQNRIEQFHAGELLVGTADIVETNNTSIPYLIIAPTMRVPMLLRNSVNPYLAARAVFLFIKHGVFHDGQHRGEPIAKYINTIAMPGLGTGVGQISPNTSAHQMRQAINDILLNQYTSPKTWAQASDRHQSLYTTNPQRLQHTYGQPTDDNHELNEQP